MSRSGYSEDLDNWDLIRWRGAVASAIRGSKGQAFLKEMLISLDALSEKRLIAHELSKTRNTDSSTKVLEVCAIGAVGASRGIDMQKLDPEDCEGVASAFGIAPAMAAEIVFMNDESYYGKETPEERYLRMRKWVIGQIKPQAE